MSNFTSYRILESNDLFKNLTKDVIGLSSEICDVPLPNKFFNKTDKINSGITIDSKNVIILDDNNNFNITFTMSGDMSAIENNDLGYSFEIYKYNNNIFGFDFNSKIKKMYSQTLTSQTINFTSNELQIDNEYLIKTKFSIKRCVGYENERFEMANVKGLEYLLYNESYDDYFILLGNAKKPLITTSENDLISGYGSLKNSTILISKDNTYFVNFDSNLTISEPIITLGGLVLSKDFDYLISGNTIYFNAPLNENDILNVIYLDSNTNYKLFSEIFDYDRKIVSGSTNSSFDKLFYNNVKNKYEYLLDYEPLNFNDFVLTLNGVILNKNIDYFQSKTNPKKIVFNGVLFIGDILNVFYINNIPYVNEVSESEINISWVIEQAPTNDQGEFILELSNDKEFNDIIFSSKTNYIIGFDSYNSKIILSGNFGDTKYYRVRNIKKYTTIKGDLLVLENVSDVIKIKITSGNLDNY